MLHKNRMSQCNTHKTLSSQSQQSKFVISSTYPIKTTLCLNQNKHGRGLLSERISLTGLKHTYNCSFSVPAVLHISLRLCLLNFLIKIIINMIIIL